MPIDILIKNWGISSELLVEEAKKKGCKVEIFSEENNLFSLSQWSTVKYFKSIDSHLNSSFWLKCSDNKELTYMIWEKNTLKVPKSIYLNIWDTLTIKEATESLTLPIISKPIDGAHGDGVFLNITTENELQEALKYSFSVWSNRVVVQEQISWEDHRILVVGWKVVAGTKRIPPFVIWDGEKTIQELIEIENLSPDRHGKDHQNKMSPIKIDSELENCITEQWYNMGSTLEKWTKISVRKNANLSSWGLAIDVTDSIHPENIQQCLSMADLLGLWVCGVDIFTTDISKSIYDTNGAIIEVNATPWIRMHHFPSIWTPRNVAGAIVDSAFKL